MQMIPYDQLFHCSNCNEYTTHQCKAYIDVEYRTCTRCGYHSTWTSDGKELRKTRGEKKDPTKATFDHKRRNRR